MERIIDGNVSVFWNPGIRAATQHLVVVLAGLLGAVLVLVVSPAHPRPSPAFTMAVEARVLSLVNGRARRARSEALERERRLDAAAEYFGGYIAARASSTTTRMAARPPHAPLSAGYSYCVISENIATNTARAGLRPSASPVISWRGWRDRQRTGTTSSTRKSRRPAWHRTQAARVNFMRCSSSAARCLKGRKGGRLAGGRADAS